MKRERFEHIDLLRAFAIVGMMAIHILQYSLTGPLQYFFWNYLHFVEALFVFCSGYVLISQYQNTLSGWKETVRWYAKRIKRLLIPFYIYLIVHYLLWILFPNLFSGLGLSKSITFIWQSIFLVGGISLNWLVLLFVELTILFPVFARLVKKRKLLTIFIILSLTETIFFTVQNFNNLFRYLMWIPWSLIFLFSNMVYQKEQQKLAFKKYLSWGFISLGVFLFLYAIIGQTGQSLRLFDNKYPPNLYYLTYGFGMVSLSIVLSRLQIFSFKPMKKIYTFISTNSYQLFFIHFIVLDLVIKQTPGLFFWSNELIQFILVLVGSLTVSVVLKKVNRGNIKA